MNHAETLAKLGTGENTSDEELEAISRDLSELIIALEKFGRYFLPTLRYCYGELSVVHRILDARREGKRIEMKENQ